MLCVVLQLNQLDSRLVVGLANSLVRPSPSNWQIMRCMSASSNPMNSGCQYCLRHRPSIPAAVSAIYYFNILELKNAYVNFSRSKSFHKCSMRLLGSQSVSIEFCDGFPHADYDIFQRNSRIVSRWNTRNPASLSSQLDEPRYILSVTISPALNVVPFAYQHGRKARLLLPWVIAHDVLRL